MSEGQRYGYDFKNYLVAINDISLNVDFNEGQSDPINWKIIGPIIGILGIVIIMGIIRKGRKKVENTE